MPRASPVWRWYLAWGGGTSSYQEIEETDCILLWGSNARETHPIFFHHLLAGLKRGAKLYAIDPRRTATAQWAEVWAGLDVGTDIALSNTMAREIIASGLANCEFIDHATTGFEAYRDLVEPWTLERGAAETGVPAAVIREMAHTFATARSAIICWTLGITEHHTAVHNVMSLINLALLTGHVGRWGSGLNPLRGQTNAQGGGDMGALPDRLPGFQHIENDAVRAKFDAFYGVTVPPKKGWHLSDMFNAMDRGELRALYVIGENPVQSEADQHRATRLLEGLELLVVQDIVLTETARRADVVFPAAAGAFESAGTFTNSERRVQRVRKTLDPPGLLTPGPSGHGCADPLGSRRPIEKGCARAIGVIRRPEHGTRTKRDDGGVWGPARALPRGHWFCVRGVLCG